MKKIYINPELNFIKIASRAQMLAGSNPGVGGSTNDKNDLLSRSIDWDED